VIFLVIIFVVLGIYTLATNILGNDCGIENGIEKECASGWIM
jgi:hypothetical protein